MTFIIAELGINHDGDIEVAKKLIYNSFKAGVDAVKFQYRNMSRAYAEKTFQIGDSILRTELEKNYLSPMEIEVLRNYAKDLDLKVGISFFSREDVGDFTGIVFDFYKVPSVEFTNNSLIDILLTKGAPVYLSLGCQSEPTIARQLDRLGSYDKIHILHCVSNYPVQPRNAALGYIAYFRQKYGRNIGYSSHDADWRYVLYAVAFGARVVERHITLDASKGGLDNSTSSTPTQFTQMVELIRGFEHAKDGGHPRLPNQGELLNMQNLGRSYYADRDIRPGEMLTIEHFVFRAPAIGLSSDSILKFIGQPLQKPIAKGEALCADHFSKPSEFSSNLRDSANKFRLSLPIRFHDQALIDHEFGLKNYEFHLTYDDLEKASDLTSINRTKNYSVHAPDYIDSLTLFDPFCRSDNGRRSREVLNKVLKFAASIQQVTGSVCVVVASFNKFDRDVSERVFYEGLKDLTSHAIATYGVELLPQWLPPFAWYFGGSVSLHAFNTTGALAQVVRNEIDICLDLSHFAMCVSATRMSWQDFEPLLDRTRHVHLSGADGIDGEGVKLSRSGTEFLDRIPKIIKFPCTKVIETWQGHLNNFQGFKDTISDIADFVRD